MRSFAILLFVTASLVASTPSKTAPKTAGGAPSRKAGAMVARVWRGRVPAARADEYAKYLYENGPVKMRRIAGNLGVEQLRRDVGNTTEFMVISYWPDRESIKAFAGAEIEKTHFLPRDREFLIDPEETVRHYDIATP